MVPSQQAGILCGNKYFRTFVAQRLDLETAPVTSEAAAEYIRSQCQIMSRRDLDTNEIALRHFQSIQTEFDVWRGRIAQPR